MPRLLSDVWSHFNVTQDRGKRRVACNYCQKSYVIPSATRLKEHLLSCKKCPYDLKMQLKVDTSKKGTASGEHSTGGGIISTQSSSVATPSTSAVVDSILPAEDVAVLAETSTEEIDAALARAIYATGAPLAMFESIYWKKAFSLILPGYECPSRYSLSRPLLEAEYARVHKAALDKVAGACSLGLIADGWTNTCGRGVVNILITTPEPVFYKSIYPGVQRETASFISEEISKVIDEVGHLKFTAVITDNASNMRAAWRQLCRKYPHIACIGCAAHCLNLLYNDLMKIDHFTDTFNITKTIVKYIKKKNLVLAYFEERQKDKYGNLAQTLKLPSNTRWGYSVVMFKSVLANREALENTVIALELRIDPDIKKNVLGDNMWTRIKDATSVLSPVFDAIKAVEGDNAILSDVVVIFEEILQKITEYINEPECLVSNKKNDIEKVISNRREFSMTPIHYTANLLDPRFRGRNLKDEEFISAMEYISSFASSLNLEVSRVVAEIAEYRIKAGFWSSEVLWSSVQLVQPRMWWQGLVQNKLITIIASRILSIPPSSAACERNWSLFGRTHTKSRNRLCKERLDKLIAVRSNLKFMQRAGKDTFSQTDTSTDNTTDSDAD